VTATSTPPKGSAPASDAPVVSAPKKRGGFKFRYVVALAICLGAVIWMITSLSKNINYLETVSKAVQQRSGQQHREIRIGGVVVKNTLRQVSSGADFKLGDGKATVFVHVTNIPSKLFAECAPVVVQGQWNGVSFAGDNLLVAHDANYGTATDKTSVNDALKGTGCQKPT
jgi:cytochrome c-type biogenesis protein CcmE